MHTCFSKYVLTGLLLLSLLPLSLQAEEVPEPTQEPTAPTAAVKEPGTAEILQGSILFGSEVPAPQVSSETNDSAPRIAYKIQGAPDSTYSEAVPTAVGVYTVQVTYPETDTHLQASAAVDFTIRAVISNLSLEPLGYVPSRAYNGKTEPAPPLPGILPLAFTVEGTPHQPQPDRDYAVSAVLLSSKADSDPDSRNLKITVSFLDGLYAPAEDLQTEFFLHADILPAPITIKALDQAAPEGFDSSLNQVTWEGLMEGDSLTEITLYEEGAQLFPSSPRIFRGETEVTDQYEISLLPGALTRSASLTALPQAAEKLSYNGMDQALLSSPGEAAGGTPVYEVRFHASQSAEEILLSPWSETLPTGKAPGIYTIFCKVRGDTLLDSQPETILSVIAPRVLTITASGEKYYDGTRDLPGEAITVTLPEDQIVPGEQVSVSSIEGCCFQQISAGEDLKILPGTVVLSGEDAGNYSVKIASITGTILPRPVTVRAEAGKKHYGQADPEYACRAEGLVPGEQLAGTLSRVPGQDAGTYEITQGSLTEERNPNYRISFQPALFTIRRARPELTLSLSRRSSRPGKTLTVTATARNAESRLAEGSWSQPGALTLSDGSALHYSRNGKWTAQVTVPQNAENSLTYTVKCSDPNYRPAEASASLRISGPGPNPYTGDLILLYGTMLLCSGFLLAAIALWYFKFRKK